MGEQEILRVHGRAARALANQPLPHGVCTFMRDENVYTPIDPCQEEKNRDIRSRYNGRLFLSWLQDVDDKWERIKVTSLKSFCIVISKKNSFLSKKITFSTIHIAYKAIFFFIV